MPLDQKDMEMLEHLIYKSGDDIAVSASRSLERLEERLDAMESRLNSRFSDQEDRIEAARQDTADELSDLRAEMREFSRFREAEAA